MTLDESSPQWVPAKTPTVHWGRYDGRPWALSTPHRLKSRTMTEHWDVTTDRSSDKHGSGAGYDHTRNVTIIELEDVMTAGDESKLTRK